MNRVVLAIMGAMAALVVAVGVLIVVVVTTGGDDSSNAPSATDEPNATDEPASSGDTLRISGPEPITLDPHIAQDASSAVYIVEIFGGLLTLDPQLNVQPDLAAEIPTLENGGKVVNADGTAT